MRRLVALFCLLSLCLLAAPSQAGAPQIVAVSIPPQAWLVQRIGGPFVKPMVLLPPGASPATYEPGPRQLADLGAARLYLPIGVPFERAFLPRVKGNFPNLKVVPMQAGIKLRRLEGHDGHGHKEHAPGHDPGAPDPHVWLGPHQMAQMAVNTARALSALDPAHAAQFQANLAKVQAELKEVDARLARRLAPLKGRVVLVYHPAYGYLLGTYGLRQEAVELEGKEPGPRRLAAIVDQAKAKGIKVIFVQPQFSPASASALARAMGGVVVSLDPLAYDYLKNLRALADKIARGLR